MGEPNTCPDCNVVHEGGCPKCGRELYYGYGLAGGGIGAYVACDCGYFQKELDEEHRPPAEDIGRG